MQAHARKIEALRQSIPHDGYYALAHSIRTNLETVALSNEEEWAAIETLNDPGRSPTGPGSPLDGPRIPRVGSKMAIRWPKMARDSPKAGQDHPKIVPTWAQDGSDMGPSGPRWPELALRGAKTAPRSPQDGPQMAQDGLI